MQVGHTQFSEERLKIWKSERESLEQFLWWSQEPQHSQKIELHLSLITKLQIEQELISILANKKAKVASYS